MELLLLSNISFVYGLNITFYAAQELQILNICSLEYQTTFGVLIIDLIRRSGTQTEGDLTIFTNHSLSNLIIFNFKDISYFFTNAKIPNETDHNMKCLFYCVSQKIGVHLDYEATQSHNKDKRTEKSKTTPNHVRVNHKHQRTTKNKTETTTAGLIHLSENDLRNGH